MLKAIFLILMSLPVSIAFATPVEQTAVPGGSAAPLPGQIVFADPVSPRVLNPVLLWDAGQSGQNRFSLTEFPGALSLTSAANDPIGPAVCYPVSGDFTTEVRVSVAPAADGQGGGMFVRLPGTWDTYIGISRYRDDGLHGVASWGLYDANTPLVARGDAFIAAEVNLRIERRRQVFTLSYKGGGQRSWKAVRRGFAFSMTNNVEVCLNLWSEDAERSFSGRFEQWTVAAGSSS